MDKKFIIAIVIIVILVLTLLTILVIKPKVKEYYDNKLLSTQNEVINAIIFQANTNGYIVLSNGTDDIALIKYIPEEQ